ncbi:MAG: 50S ribosomal protein L18 [Candidatus Aenigmarchaeota archaeon]|nr:50S ribosomal protein L18 [Candidatus Aenigmarchaeota archaeon]
MKRRKTLRLPHRRKREGKTDYHLRLRLLKSKKPRFVVRKSSNNIICQIIRFEITGDKVVVSVDSKELKKFGWKYHCGNLPAAYLTGFLCAEKAKHHKVKEVVFDMGLYGATQGNRLFSTLKGAVDGGLNVPHSEEILPKQERFSGKHIADYAEKLKAEDAAKYKKVFSAHIKNKTEPKDLPKAFEDAKKKISAGKHEPKKTAAKATKKTETKTPVKKKETNSKKKAPTKAKK